MLSVYKTTYRVLEVRAWNDLSFATTPDVGYGAVGTALVTYTTQRITSVMNRQIEVFGETPDGKQVHRRFVNISLGLRAGHEVDEILATRGRQVYLIGLSNRSTGDHELFERQIRLLGGSRLFALIGWPPVVFTLVAMPIAVILWLALTLAPGVAPLLQTASTSESVGVSFALGVLALISGVVVWRFIAIGGKRGWLRREARRLMAE